MNNSNDNSPEIETNVSTGYEMPQSYLDSYTEGDEHFVSSILEMIQKGEDIENLLYGLLALHNNSLLLPYIEEPDDPTFPTHAQLMVQRDIQNSVNALIVAGVKNPKQHVFQSRETAIRLFAGAVLSHQIKESLAEGKKKLNEEVTKHDNRPEPTKENLVHHQDVNASLAEKVVEAADFYGLTPGFEQFPLQEGHPALNKVNVEGVRRVVADKRISETALKRNLGEIVKNAVRNLRHLGDNLTKSAQVRAAKTQFTLQDNARNIEALIGDVSALTQDIVAIATNESLPLTERERQIYSYLDQVNLTGMSYEIVAALEQSQINIENEIAVHDGAITAMQTLLEAYSENNLARLVETSSEARTAIARILGKAYLMKRGLI